MDDLLTQYTSIVMNKDTFIKNIRLFIENFVSQLPPYIKEDIGHDIEVAKLVDCCMVVYDELYQQYFDLIKTVHRELYTDDQLQILLDFHKTNPWFLELQKESAEVLLRRTKPICDLIQSRIASEIEKSIT